MKQYSFVILASVDVVLEDVGLAFLAGRNAFTFVTGDLPGLLERFELEGIRVLEMHSIDVPEASALNLLLEGETADVAGLHAWRSGS